MPATGDHAPSSARRTSSTCSPSFDERSTTAVAPDSHNMLWPTFSRSSMMKSGTGTRTA